MACKQSSNNNATNDPSKVAQEKTVYSWVDELNIRDQPNTKGKVIAAIESDHALELTETKSGKMETIVLRGVAYQDYWYQVRTSDGKEGWAFGGALKQKNEQKGNAILTTEKFSFPNFGDFDLSDWKSIQADKFGGGDVEGSTQYYQKGDKILEISASDMGEYGYGFSQKLMDSNKKILKERDFRFGPTEEPNGKSKITVEVKDYTQTPPKKYSRVQKVAASRYDLKPKPVMASGNWQTGSLDAENPTGAPISMRSFLDLSSKSIFDHTTEGISDAEKKNLVQKGASSFWKITEETNTKLVIKGEGDDEVKLYFLPYPDNSDGSLAVQTRNGKTSKIQLWNYFSGDKNLHQRNNLKKYSANAFVSKADQLPNSYQPQLHYEFIDDQTIEVSLYTWMQKEFENREIINKIFLKWDGADFEEKIVKIKAIKILDKSSYDLSKLKYDGKIVHKRFWQDGNGENIALFTKKDKEELFVYHYTINAGNVKELRKVYDFEKDCDFDLILEFMKDAIKITDLDHNNFGELTFAYRKACVSDVSPLGLKLLMLENDHKFIIRGTTSIDQPGFKVDGKKNVDASFNNAPASFLSHADKIWDNIKQQ